MLGAEVRTTRRPGFKVFEVIVGDESGGIRATWLNQPYLRDVFTRGQHVMLYGPAELRGTAGMQLTNPQYEILNEEGDGEGETIHTGRIVPVYEKAGSVTSKMQRKIVHDALDRLPRDLADSLPERLLTERRWPSRYAALLALHFPPSDVPIDALNRFETPAQQRLIYEEAFAFQLGLLARRRFASLDRKASTIIVDDRIRASARAVLPFRLTNGQRQALKEIVEDLQRPQPMNRLLQGDVGAGKTIVALLAALVAMENGLQVAFMAPTEILAEQHYLNVSRLLQASRFRVALLTGGSTTAARRAHLAEIAGGSVHLVVGTHALVQGDVAFHRLGLVVIDEQHRFGVMQRGALFSVSGYLIDEDGRAIPDVTLTLVPVAGAGSAVVARGTTNGRFTIGGVQPGSYQLMTARETRDTPGANAPASTGGSTPTTPTSPPATAPAAAASTAGQATPTGIIINVEDENLTGVTIILGARPRLAEPH